MSAQWAQAWLRASAAAVHERSAWLTELDAAIGDGDHGINLDRGFGLVVARLDAQEAQLLPAGVVLAEAGRVMLGSVGGASGALYGRALARAGAAIPEPDVRAGDVLPLDVIVRAFEAAVEAIAALGRSGPGDKTMLDALIPALGALRASAGAETSLGEALQRAAQAAEVGLEATRPLVARRGRASYLGERSAGHLDPGAASSALLVRALAETCPPAERASGG
jgi:dihydroxyacetone kinase-like protein